jgi:PAS domain S-box-containing protein
MLRFQCCGLKQNRATGDLHPVLPIAMSEASAAPPATSFDGVALRAWLAQSFDLLLLTDTAGRIEWASERFEAATGAVAGMHLEALLPVDLPAALHDAVRRGLAGHPLNAVALQLRCRDGRTLPVRASVAGIGERRLWTLQDGSALERSTARAAHADELLAMAQEFGRLGVWERDVASGTGRWDQHVFAFWGLPPGDATPDLDIAIERVHPDDRALVARHFSPLGAIGRHAQRYRVLRPNGSTRWIHSQWELKAGDDGRPDRALGIMMDDTESVELARSLHRAHAHLVAAVDLGQMLVWRHDLKSGLLHHPGVHADSALDLPDGLAIGVEIERLHANVHPQDLPLLIDASRHALRGSAPVDAELRYRGRAGGWRTVLVRQVAERDDAGAPAALIGVTFDITERVEQRQRAEELGKRIEAAAQAAQVGIWIAAAESDGFEWNAQMYTLFDRIGPRRPPSWARWLARCVHRGDRDRVRREVEAFVHSALAPLQIEFRSQRADGSVRWIEMRSAVERDPDGPPRLVGVALDVTERHAAVAALHEAGERTTFITSTAGIGTWEMHHRNGIVHWDEQMFRLRGIDPARGPLTRDERLALIHPDDRPRILAALEDETSRQTFAYEFRVRLPDGRIRWLASRSALVPAPDGGRARRVGVNWDITEAKNAEQARQRQLIAERDSEARLAFMSRMSHELRTPLNAVLGFTQLLQTEAADAGRAADLGKLKHIRNAGEHLLALIDDVLELTGLESGDAHLDLQAVVISEVVGAARERVEALAAQRSVQIVSGPLDGRAHADPARLTQAFVKLLDNAIRYNRPRGEVLIEAAVAGDRVRVSVRDDGPGLDAEQLAHLFEPFARSGRRAGRIERAGIGLTVVKALVERMGGTIDVTSQPGMGSVVELTLPLHADTAAPPPSAERALAQRAGRLLYIEDNSVNVLLVEQMVATLPGLTIVSEATGGDGVARAQALQPDLILVDMELPDFDGYEVLRRLRRQPETADTICIALSANALPEDIARGLAEGFADYWTKPIDFKAFTAALEQLFPARR